LALIPLLYALVLRIWLSTYWSPDAKPASGPVSGVTKPIVIVPLLDCWPEPLIPELHAASAPPAPTATAPAPMPLSTERRPTETGP
jgi:hypothetical protein